MENKYKNKKIVIWGLGLHGGGLGVAKFLANQGAKLLITDLRDAKTLKPTLNKLKKYSNIKYVLGKHEEKDFFSADFIVANQAIKPFNPLYKKLQKNKKKILSEIGIFYEFNQAMVVGITGTKGKSTITALIYDLLKQALKEKNPFLKDYNKIFFGGNIRKSVYDTLAKADKKSIIVIELSSFQLEQAKYVKQSPHISIITNITPEHLD
jgi:UDP-N-acetylmuramoylalanine--D-glutamate ligase